MRDAGRILGIDLGTSNCAVASVEPGQGPGALVADFQVCQLVQPGQCAERPLLPSMLYLPAGHELPSESTRLPWGDSPHRIVGEFARWQGSRVPGRLIASAKSWLCHPGVDRSAPILPWGSSEDVARASPVEVTAELLLHIKNAWNHAHPELPLEKQDVVITVPASFDEVARSLTVSAAQKAGLEDFSLLEEPQAAFYDFMARHRADLSSALGDARLVLVVDAGGGTFDLSLIEAGVSEDGPSLRRVAVGDHLMLGGDNMDATVGRFVEGRLMQKGRKLSPTQWSQLLQTARAAKEALLGETAPDKRRIALAGEGSRLLGATLSTEVTRDEVEKLILDGFLPHCAPDETPKRSTRSGIQELGLPFAADPAMTRHVLAFLRLHRAAGLAALDEADDPAVTLPRPDAIVFNGGVFNSPRMRQRFIDVVSAWWPEQPSVRLLEHDSLDLAVARGAAYYGLVRRGLGRRISGGAARALYVGLAERKRSDLTRTICLVPRGHEEGQPVELAKDAFTLKLGQPVQFPLFSTTADRADPPGELVEIDESFLPLPPIHTLFKGSGSGRIVPVHLRATLTELGTLELWCVSNESDERWRLEFDLRGAGARPRATIIESMPESLDQARIVVERIFGSKPRQIDLKEVKDLVRTIESSIGTRDTWSLPLLRELWSVLMSGAKRRRRSEHHERVFFQLVGYCLRPGFGYPLDEWRGEQTFGLFSEGVTHRAEQKVWREFWVLWRRIAGGLEENHHQAIWKFLKPHLERLIVPRPSKNRGKPRGTQPGGLDEMVRTAAALEHIDPWEKVQLGNWIARRLELPETRGGPWAWSLGRLGARVPVVGSSHKTIAPERVAPWIERLLASNLTLGDGSAFAAMQLARITGDRTRDVDDVLRQRVLQALETARAPERWLHVLREAVATDIEDEARALGDSLPVGLSLR